jgi:hypothetical protein
MELTKLSGSGISKTDLFIATHSNYFMGHHLAYLKDRLDKLDDSRWLQVFTTDLKEPGNIQLVSLFAGQLGIDRFMIGDTGLGVGKLLTCGGLGIWTIVDWFSIKDATKQKNMEILQSIIG